MKLARTIYQVTQEMPKVEQFGLVSQMRRAAVSIPSNIAEGYGRQSTADYLKHLRISRGSLAELSTQFELAIQLKLLKEKPEALSLLAEEDRVLQGLIRSLEVKD
jgi:four helix bundle protein